MYSPRVVAVNLQDRKVTLANGSELPLISTRYVGTRLVGLLAGPTMKGVTYAVSVTEEIQVQ